MLSQVIGNSALCTKIKCMLGKMLDNDDYEMLLKSSNVNQIAQKLKEYDTFSEVLGDVDSQKIHRADLEFYLQTEFILEFKKLYNFSGNETKKFYDMYFRKIELDMLKTIARDVNIGLVHKEEINEFVQKHISYDVSYMRSSASLNELVEKLKYYGRNKVLYNMLKTHKKITVFDFEMTLDIYAYQCLIDIVKNGLKGDDQKDAQQILGYETDIQNLKWIYRSKMNFSLNRETVYSYIIPNYYKLNEEMITKLVSAPGKDEFLKILSDTPYRVIFEDNEFEKNSAKFLNKAYRMSITKYPYSFVNILCYLMLKKCEAANIISIIEGIRYNLSPDEIKEFLVL